MRSLRIVWAAVVATALLLPPTAAGAHSRALTKAIEVPTGITGFQNATACADPYSRNCQKLPVSRHVRCLYLTDPSLNQDSRKGRFGYVIALKKSERDGRHRFRLTNATPGGNRDFDVTLYKTLATCQTSPPAEAVKTHASMGGESGRIPKGMRYAIVTMFGAPNGTFKFRIS